MLEKKVHMNNAHTSEECQNVKKLMGMKVPLFPYSRFDMSLFSQCAASIETEVITLRLFYKIS
jgi:hypothetical protein